MIWRYNNMKIVVDKIENININKDDVLNWRVWTCPVSNFNWEYDSKEMCLFLSGRVGVSSETGTLVLVANDFVIFPKGLKCHWNVIEPVIKHYHLEDSV